LILRDGASAVLFIAALAALGTTALLGARWRLNGNTAPSRRQRLERRESGGKPWSGCSRVLGDHAGHGRRH
jgi:hypothetical protein